MLNQVRGGRTIRPPCRGEAGTKHPSEGRVEREGIAGRRTDAHAADVRHPKLAVQLPARVVSAGQSCTGPDNSANVPVLMWSSSHQRSGQFRPNWISLSVK
jgi:hypothetical protein